MIILLGLVILVAAVVIGAAGVLANGGGTHLLAGNFAVFGYHVTGSTGLLFLYGVVVGAVGLCGLSLLLSSARRTSLRGRAARRELTGARRETAALSRDHQNLVEHHQGGTTAAGVGVDPGRPNPVAGPQLDRQTVSTGAHGTGRETK
ncbi:MAG: hypothetical protein ACYDAQ_12645 [Mycobacteriales bacterium]